MTNRTYTDLHTDLTEWLEGVLKDGLDVAKFATVLIEENEPMDNGKIHIEVAGRHSKSGNPVTGKFDYYHDADENEIDSE